MAAAPVRRSRSQLHATALPKDRLSSNEWRQGVLRVPERARGEDSKKGAIFANGLLAGPNSGKALGMVPGRHNIVYGMMRTANGIFFAFRRMPLVDGFTMSFAINGLLPLLPSSWSGKYCQI